MLTYPHTKLKLVDIDLNSPKQPFRKGGYKSLYKFKLFYLGKIDLSKEESTYAI